MTICRKCGTSNPDGKKFCAFCHELLIADPVELEKRADAEQKKQQKQQRKMQKKLDAKHKRWKRALLLLIPIGVLDLLVLILCLDLAFIGIGAMLGSALGEAMSDILGNIIELFGNQVYTDQFVGFLVRGLEFSCTLGLLLIASVLAVVMIVRMIKWHIYQKKGVQVQEDQGAFASASAQDTSTADLPIEEQGVFVILKPVGDGILQDDPDCKWITSYLAGASGVSPEEIVYRICLHAAEGEEHDDCSAIALRIQNAEQN